MSANSKTDPLQAKAEPISDAGITYIRKGKSPVQFSQRNMGEHERAAAMQTPKSEKEVGQEVLQVLEPIPLQPVVQTMVKQLYPNNLFHYHTLI
ncbi:hypothetical protein TURU_034071 [Turdus rufiventris]|nr:hypothetical protein TURU_034071 [Turdus rufiventris]